VAAGFTDGFFETGLNPWDVAAGSLLVTEAGGLIGNFTGEPDFLEQRECLAGAPRIYGQLVPLLAKYSKFAGIDDKMRASDRVRAVSAAARPGADESVDLYARSTVTELTAAPLDGEAPAPVAAPSAPVSRKLTRIRRDTPADGSPSEGDISAK
jgi:myo-inositol-1(or 4)-monophosphatase